MATMQCNFRSQTLARNVEFFLVYPNDILKRYVEKNPHFERKTKLLILLHGYGSSYAEWVLNSNLQEIAGTYNLAVVCPNGENSFYLNHEATGRAYANFIGQELPDYVAETFGIGAAREDTLIGGLSMGGFGAVHTAFSYPERFAGLISLSGALIQNKVGKMKPDDAHDGIANYAYYELMFGAPEALAQSDNNPDYLIRQLVEQKAQIPAIYMACGTEDFLLQENRDMHQLLEQLEVRHTYAEGPGDHNWEFWRTYIRPGIEQVLKETER